VIVDPGELDQRITIQSESRASDGSGGYAMTWETRHGPIWAKVRPSSAREVERSGQLHESAMYTVIIRNRDVSEADRVLWQGRTLNIRSVGIDPRSPYIRITAELGAET